MNQFQPEESRFDERIRSIFSRHPMDRRLPDARGPRGTSSQRPDTLTKLIQDLSPDEAAALIYPILLLPGEQAIVRGKPTPERQIVATNLRFISATDVATVAFFWTAIKSIGWSSEDRIDPRSEQPSTILRQIFLDIAVERNLNFTFSFGPESAIMPEIISAFYQEGQMQIARNCDHDAWAAHALSTGHKNLIANSEHCGCFHCLTIFSSNQIVDWTDEDEKGESTTALCPNCGVDAVLPSTNEYPLTLEFLERMAYIWLGRERSSRPDNP
jgi:hypothetical protein